MKMHRHHISYKPEIIIRVPSWYHWFLHFPCSLFLGGFWWHPKGKRGAVWHQNKAAKQMCLKWLLGYPNVIQQVFHLIGWIAWNL